MNTLLATLAGISIVIGVLFIQAGLVWLAWMLIAVGIFGLPEIPFMYVVIGVLAVSALLTALRS